MASHPPDAVTAEADSILVLGVVCYRRPGSSPTVVRWHGHVGRIHVKVSLVLGVWNIGASTTAGADLAEGEGCTFADAHQRAEAAFAQLQQDVATFNSARAARRRALARAAGAGA